MASNPIPLLMYHQIDVRPHQGSPMRGLVVSTPTFTRQMEWLKRLGYQGLSMPAVLPYLRGEQQGKVVGITFDDGYLNNLENAMPVLQRLGFSATCYVVSGKIGGKNEWDYKQGIDQKTLMSHAHMRQWLAAGQDIGAHSCSHADLSALAAEKAQHEITQCKISLEDALGHAVQHFCYPYGRFLPEHELMVRDAGYTSATTTQRGRVAIQDSIKADTFYRLPRVQVMGSVWWPQFLRKIMTGYEDGRN